MMNRRTAASLAFVLGLFALAACAAPTEEQGPVFVRDGKSSDSDRSPAPSPSSSSSSTSPAESYVEPGSSETDTPDEETSTVKRELGITWKGQETSYWCGPGSTRIAISSRMQEPPTQTELATLMGTTKNGTDHVGLVADALNKYISGANYARHDISDPPTQAQRDQLKKDVVARVSAGFPMVANVISGWRPPGYPSGTIYHYVAIVGYDQSGMKVQIADPAGEGSGGSTWTGVPRTYWVSIDDLATWIGGKGYAG